MGADIYSCFATNGHKHNTQMEGITRDKIREIRVEKYLRITNKVSQTMWPSKSYFCHLILPSSSSSINLLNRNGIEWAVRCYEEEWEEASGEEVNGNNFGREINDVCLCSTS